MKKLIFLIGIFVIFATLTVMSNDFTYTGAGKCKICHKTKKQGEQYPLWESRKHSKAYQSLSSDKAPERAKEMGVEGSLTDSPKCLKCHGPVAEFKEEGVTCEFCHGPGSAYKKMKIMKSREESVKNGLIVYDSPDAIKKQCLTCHENAHGTTFDFATAWEKVKHPTPEKK